MCNHGYAKLHPKEPCVICFHEIFNNMSMTEIKTTFKEVHQ